MRTSIVATLPFLILSGAAFAADVPEIPPAEILSPTPAAYDWTGFHFGVNAGGGMSSDESSFGTVGGPNFLTATNDLSGVLGGFQAGYDWQFGQAVFGVETDFQWTGLEGDIKAPCPTASCTTAVNARFTQKMPWFGTVRGRVGYAADGFLLYATGGYAYGEAKTEGRASAPGVRARFSRTEVQSGWTLGAGIAVGLAENVSLKLEYDYVDLGSMQGRFALPGLPDIRYDTRLTENIVRVGIDYRF